MGELILAGGSTAAKSTGSPAFTFIILAVLVVLFYVLIMRPQRNRQRRTMQTQNAVVPGQRIRTTAGMYGTVISGDDRDVVVEISPGVQITMLRRAIMDVVPEDDYGPETPSADGDHAQEPQDSTPADDWDLKDRNI
jgi:preprotein translocase subunit YajC